MAKEINLDELANEAIEVNLGEACAFCVEEGNKPFMNTKENDFVKHLIEEHKPTFMYMLGKAGKEKD